MLHASLFCLRVTSTASFSFCSSLCCLGMFLRVIDLLPDSVPYCTKVGLNLYFNRFACGSTCTYAGQVDMLAKSVYEVMITMVGEVGKEFMSAHD